jgi:hypothetical protein
MKMSGYRRKTSTQLMHKDLIRGIIHHGCNNIPDMIKYMPLLYQKL